MEPWDAATVTSENDEKPSILARGAIERRKAV